MEAEMVGLIEFQWLDYFGHSKKIRVFGLQWLMPFFEADGPDTIKRNASLLTWKQIIQWVIAEFIVNPNWNKKWALSYWSLESLSNHR